MKILLICFICLFLSFPMRQNEHDREIVLFEFIEKFEPLVAKYLHFEADFLRVLEKLHILTPAQACSKCQEHYKSKQDKYYNKDTFITKEAYKLIDDICKAKLTPRECDGLINRYAPRFLHNYLYHYFDPEFQCGKIGICSNYKELSIEDYRNQILSDMPAPKEIPIKNQYRYKIVHLTDTHVEMNYEIGSEAQCPELFCCTTYDGKAKSDDTAAGKWGTQKGACDLPIHTVEEGIKYIANVLKPDIVVWSGDSFGHIQWTQTKDTTLDAMKQVSKWIEEYLVNKGVTVYPMWGNHESYPVDQFDYYGHDTDFLKETAYDLWKTWLPTDAINSLKERGFYSVKNEKFKFKLITVLTEVYDTINFHLIAHPTNPLNELEWLEKEFREAEETGYPVIITGHIPNGDPSGQSQWQMRYNILCERYQNIIRGQFYGHYHVDAFTFLNKQDSQTPFGLSFVSPCYTGGHTVPSLRVYEFDGETNALLNVITYRIDITKANKDNAASLVNYFYKAYDFVSYYNLNDYITLNQMVDLNKKFVTDSQLLEKYLYNYHQQYYTMEEIQNQIRNDKNGYIKKLKYCESRYSVYNDFVKCAGAAMTSERIYEVYKGLSDFSNIWYEITNEIYTNE